MKWGVSLDPLVVVVVDFGHFVLTTKIFILSSHQRHTVNNKPSLPTHIVAMAQSCSSILLLSCPFGHRAH